MPPHPADGLDLWYEFGFCTCRDEFEESGLAAEYAILVGGDRLREQYEKELDVPCERRRPEPSICSFGEFWYAWLHGSLGALMPKHGMEFRKETSSTAESRSTCFPEFLSYRMGD